MTGRPPVVGEVVLMHCAGAMDPKLSDYVPLTFARVAGITSKDEKGKKSYEFDLLLEDRDFLCFGVNEQSVIWDRFAPRTPAGPVNARVDPGAHIGEGIGGGEGGEQDGGARGFEEEEGASTGRGRGLIGVGGQKCKFAPKSAAELASPALSRALRDVLEDHSLVTAERSP